MSFRSYGLEFGLTDNSIRDITEDKYGCIWIATDEGISRVVGPRIEKFYKSPDGTGLTGNEINCVADDPVRHVMWIGTQRDGLVAYDYDAGKFRSWRRIPGDSNSIITNDVTDMDFGDNGNLWIATYSSGIDCFDTIGEKFTHFRTDNVEGLPDNAFWCVAYDKAGGNVYGGHVGNGFSVINPVTREAVNYTVDDGLPGNEVWCVIPDEAFVWITTDKGLSRYDKDSGEIINFSSTGYDNASRYAVDMDSVLLVAMDDHGILSFNKRTCQFRRLSAHFTTSPEDHPDHLWRSDPNKLFADSHNNLIIGTLYEGLAVLSNDVSGFMVFQLPGKGHHDDKSGRLVNVRDIAAGQGSVWFGTNGNGLVGSGGIVTDDIDVVAVHCDDRGRLWAVGNNNRLIEGDISHNRVVRHDGIWVDGSRSVNFLSSGDSLWIGSSSGLMLYDKRFSRVLWNKDIDRNYIFSMDMDNDGNLWVGSFGDGVTVVDRGGETVRKYTRRTGLTSNSINDICAVGRNVWLATGEGVLRIDIDNPDSIEVVADPARSVKSIISDHSGNVWYATRSGIGVVMTDGEKMFFDKQLPLTGFNNSSVASGSDGRLFFGTNSGVLSFVPDYILSGKWLPEPEISGIIVNNGKESAEMNVSGGDDINLDYRHNNFSVVVSPSDFFVDNYSYEYRMEGLEDHWYPVGKDGMVTFRELPYGAYVFQVRNSVMTDNENSAIASLKITVEPPFWLQWWALMAYVLLFIVLCVVMFIWYRDRLRRKARKSVDEDKLANLKAMQEERVRFFTNVTHELRTPLTLINGPLEDMLRSGSLAESDRWKIDVIHKNAKRLLSLVNQLLDYRKTTTNNKRLCVSYSDIVDSVKEISMKFVELNRNPKVAISVSSSTDHIYTYFDKEVLSMVLDNLISNAMKYTESGMISVSTTPWQDGDRRCVKITVRDTGYGIGDEALPYIFDRYYQEESSHQASGTGIGLALVKALVQLHKGSITVESARGVGSCFSVVLDRDEDYPEAVHVESSPDGEAPGSQDMARGVSATAGGGEESSAATPDNIVVLVVEDNPDILEYVRQSLDGIFVVKTATNGRDGLETATTEIPDVIVTDIMMPVMDGLEMTSLLKRNVATSHIPVVMLTAKDSASDRQAGYEAGVESYITKPFNASLLISRINNIISRRHMLAEYFRKGDVDGPAGFPYDASDSESRILNDSMSVIDCEFIKNLDSMILDCDDPGRVNIDYLTDMLCMSRATLYRKMKAVTGMSGNEYIRHVRMRRAKELLLSGRHNMSEIADMLGFSSASYFRESFKTTFGMTPSEYLKSLRKKTE